MLDIRKYNRSPFQVDAVQVTKENLQEIAEWCGGQVLEHSDKGKTQKYVKVKVYRPVNEKQTRAFPGDWILSSDAGFKVYTDRAFQRSFYPEPTPYKGDMNKFETSGVVYTEKDSEDQLKEYPDETPKEAGNLFQLREENAPMLCDGCGSVDKPVVATDDGRALVCFDCKTKLGEEIDESTRKLLGFV